MFKQTRFILAPLIFSCAITCHGDGYWYSERETEGERVVPDASDGGGEGGIAGGPSYAGLPVAPCYIWDGETLKSTELYANHLWLAAPSSSTAWGGFGGTQYGGECPLYVKLQCSDGVLLLESSGHNCCYELQFNGIVDCAR